MNADCQECRDLRHKALTASKVYYKLLEDLEAAHICHDSEMVIISTRMAAAFQSRNAAIGEMTNHESTCASNKPAEAPPLSKRQGA